MHLIESVFIGKWRSFKIFQYSGKIKLESEKSFTEFEFINNCDLKIKAYKEGAIDKQIQTNEWQIVLKDKKHYLKIDKPKLIYEVITINHTVMVLVETSSSNKVFFTKEQFWEDHLKTNRSVII